MELSLGYNYNQLSVNSAYSLTPYRPTHKPTRALFYLMHTLISFDLAEIWQCDSGGKSFWLKNSFSPIPNEIQGLHSLESLFLFEKVSLSRQPAIFTQRAAPSEINQSWMVFPLGSWAQITGLLFLQRSPRDSEISPFNEKDLQDTAGILALFGPIFN